MENTSRNHPSLPSNYVSILDLKEQWLKKQRLKKQQQQQPDDVNYVTILDLKERWLKQQQQQQQQDDDVKKTDNSYEITENSVDGEMSVRSKPNFRNSGKLKSSGNPNLSRETERGFWRNPNRNNRRQYRRVLDGEEKSTTMKQYRPVNVSNSTAETQEINAEIKIDDEKKMKKKAEEGRRIEKSEEDVNQIVVSNSTAETQEINAEIKIDDEKKMKKKAKKKKNRSKDRRRRRIGENEEDVSQITKSKTGDFGVNDDEETAEIESKMKAVLVAGNVAHEKRNPAAEKRVYETTKTRNMWIRKSEYQSWGRRSFYSGEGNSNSNSNKGLMWVKRDEVLAKSKNCCSG